MSEQDVRNGVREVGEQAKSVITETTEAAKAAVSRGMTAAQEAGEAAQGMARQAAQQATAAAGTVYNQSLEARDVLEQAVVQNPFLSLLVAGAIGYGLACLVRNR